MGKIGILVEKPSAKANMSKALGGGCGVYNGEEYVIVNARGHLYEFKDPADQVSPDKAPRYRSWKLENLPWDETDFEWKYKMKHDVKNTLDEIKNTLSACEEVVIATDDDPSGEGELIAWEIFSGLNIRAKKWSRMYFVDESVKELQKAFVNRKPIKSKSEDSDYIKAFYRARWDYLSMQFTRVASKIVNIEDVALRQGRLKSAMVLLVGDALKALAEYKEIPYYQNRFRDENNVVYTNPEEPKYPTKEEVPQIYKSSDVVLDSKQMKSTPPPKLLDLAGLASRLVSKGYTASDISSTYQKMYENHVVSYPRTEDKFISPEQFNDLLPHIDKIASLVGVDTSLLTVRTPRKTHVKTGGAHGANRPGPNVPASLDELDAKYGKGAKDIYVMLAKNYLAMLAEDYEYESQKGHVKDYPKFVGTAAVPKKMGWKLVFNVDDDDDDDSSKGLGTKADPYVHEGFPPKPPVPTMKWLMTQLEKRDVGTGATRTSTYSEISSSKTKWPLFNDKRGKITMTENGDLSYHLLPGTNIGSLDMTERLFKQMKSAAEGSFDVDEGLRAVQDMVRQDIVTMQANYEIMKQLGKVEDNRRDERYSGTWNGKEVKFKRNWSGHYFTDEECEKLLAGETIEITAKSKKDGREFKASGKLEDLEYNGKPYVGFKGNVLNSKESSDDRCSGTWNGKEISFKKEWSGHKFTDEECKKLLAGEVIEIMAISKKTGSEFKASGKLEDLEYNGKPYVGFKGEIIRSDASSDDRYSGTWNGKSVSFKRDWGGHHFTDEECEKLLAGEEVTFEATNKKGNPYTAAGKLDNLEYNGHSYVGFSGHVVKAESKSDDNRYSGTWNGEQISFKREWSGHKFTDEECEKLLAGETISFTATSSKTGNEFTATGKLEKQMFKDRPFVGFKADFGNNNGGSGSGSSKVPPVPDEWCGHKFTDEEKDILSAGLSLKLEDFVSKKGNTFAATIHYGKNDRGYMGIIAKYDN